jgi:hypothetical protein
MKKCRAAEQARREQESREDLARKMALDAGHLQEACQKKALLEAERAKLR